MLKLASMGGAGPKGKGKDKGGDGEDADAKQGINPLTQQEAITGRGAVGMAFARAKAKYVAGKGESAAIEVCGIDEAEDLGLAEGIAPRGAPSLAMNFGALDEDDPAGAITPRTKEEGPIDPMTDYNEWLLAVRPNLMSDLCDFFELNIDEEAVKVAGEQVTKDQQLFMVDSFRRRCQQDPNVLRGKPSAQGGHQPLGIACPPGCPVC